MSSEQILIEESKKTIAKSGGTSVVYMPKELKEFISIGDEVKVSAKIEGNRIVVIISKLIFNFELNEIKNLLENHDFKIKEEKTIGDVRIFQADKSNISLSYTKNLFENISPAYITIKKNFSNLDYKKYNDILKKTEELKNQFDVIMRPEGDLDTVKILRNPESYKIDIKKAFTLLKKAKKKIGFSIVIRLNNKKNNIEDIKSAIEILKN